MHKGNLSKLPPPSCFSIRFSIFLTRNGGISLRSSFARYKRIYWRFPLSPMKKLANFSQRTHSHVSRAWAPALWAAETPAVRAYPLRRKDQIPLPRRRRICRRSATLLTRTAACPCGRWSADRRRPPSARRRWWWPWFPGSDAGGVPRWRWSSIPSRLVWDANPGRFLGGKTKPIDGPDGGTAVFKRIPREIVDNCCIRFGTSDVYANWTNTIKTEKRERPTDTETMVSNLNVRPDIENTGRRAQICHLNSRIVE